jgi:hypothetical protein
MGRILPRPSGTTLAQPACVARAWPTTWLAQPHAVARAHSRAWPGACAAAATALAMVARRFHGQHTPPTMRGGSPRAAHGGGKRGGPILGSHRPRRGLERWLTEAAALDWLLGWRQGGRGLGQGCRGGRARGEARAAAGSAAAAFDMSILYVPTL